MAKQMRKVRVASVVRTGMNQTAVVELVWKQRHTLYRKQMRRVTRFYVHDPHNLCTIGDTIRIQETRPISKTKHWRLLEILSRREVATVRPIELEADAELEAVDETDQSGETIEALLDKLDETETVEESSDDEGETEQ